MKGNLLEKYTPKLVDADQPEEQTGIPDDLGAFGLLRGTHDRALMLELRFKDGKRRALGYAWLHDAEFDPSEGITLHFGGRKVKISGRNLNAEIRPNVRLFQAIVRHRVPWIQEADAPAALLAARDALLIDEIVVST
jgi:hypothetical protein